MCVGGEDHFSHFNDDVRDAPELPRRRKKKGAVGKALPAEPWEGEQADDDMTGKFADAATALRFMRAGNATVTLRSLKTGTRFTYRLRESEDKQCIFVALLNGPMNESDFKYIGRISRDVFWAGRKVPKPGDIAKDAPSVQAFAWSWREFMRGVMPKALEVWHEGRCGRCGRKLTVPESIAAGFGPECEGKI